MDDARRQELKRLRAYESLMVLFVAITVVFVVAGFAALAVSRSVGTFARLFAALP